MSDIENRVQQWPAGSMGGQIDAVCDAFEEALQAGAKPRIEDYLAGWEEPERSKLLYELLLQEGDYRLRANEPFSIEAYRPRFPRDLTVLEEAFRKLTTSEDTWAPSRDEETLTLQSTLSRLRYHNRGGLGVVYVAQDQQLKRDTAIKFIHDRLADEKESCERFLLEAEITSRLEHPGVVPVYGLGRSQAGRLFYSMRFINGERFDAAIRRYHEPDASVRESGERQVLFRELLQQFIAVCHTIAYAHNRGIVHRDIKPENVMLGRYGETLVIDWGLAMPVGRQGVFKQPSEQTLKPSSGSHKSDEEGRGAGTPAYMSPEQVDGIAEIGPASDIYSLGVTLYKILTGKLPVVAHSAADLRRAILQGDYKRPTQVCRTTSKALEAICLKAMAVDPQRRYPTAMELAHDVDRYLADAPVLAYQEPVLRRWARWARRHRTWTQTFLATLVLFVLVSVAGAIWQNRLAQRERQMYQMAEAARQSEYELRQKGLQVSAEFAARTIASQVDIRWRIMEKEASDPQLASLLAPINARPLDEQLWPPLQQWLDQRRQQLYPDISCRSWFVQANDGTQVARSPSHEDNGQRFGSLGDNFAFRDYFHGTGQDYPVNRLIHPQPLSQPHNATAARSTVAGDLVVIFSVPIRTAADQQPSGVLGISIELGSFADLKINLPAGQDVLLVESRRYYMLGSDLVSQDQRGEGLVLHHQGLRHRLQEDVTSLPHVDDDVIHFMSVAKDQWLSRPAGSATSNLLPDSYRDPVANDSDSYRYLAAFAPVIVPGRPASQADTGWFVIVQQQQEWATP